MKKMSFGERIRITKRGFGILRKYCPGLSEQKALYEFIHSLQPFITIWFSARIVDELTNHCRKDYIASYVICVITINFICIVFQNVLLHICNEKESQMWIWFEKVFSDKQMSLDYDDLEDVSIQKQRQAPGHHNLMTSVCLKKPFQTKSTFAILSHYIYAKVHFEIRYI